MTTLLIDLFAQVTEEAKPEQAPLISSINFGAYIHRFVCFLARNFYNLKYVALFIAFMINFILLFYRVSIAEEDGSGSGELPDYLGSGVEASGAGSGGSGLLDVLTGSGSGAGSGDGEEEDEDEEPEEWINIEERLYYLGN